MAAKAIIDVSHAMDEGTPDIVSEVLKIDLVDPYETNFFEILTVYHQRSIRDAVVMTLCHIAAFWIYIDRKEDEDIKVRKTATRNVGILINAATKIANKEWKKSSNNKEMVFERISDFFESSYKSREMANDRDNLERDKKEIDEFIGSIFRGGL